MNITDLIQEMSLEEKIGQLCVPIVQTSEITKDIEAYIKEYRVGMLRYCPNGEYDGNSELVGEPSRYLSAGETAEFLNTLQDMAKIGMFVAVDQEGSIRNDVNRNAALAYSGHMSFGIADDTELTFSIAKAFGEECKAMGINLIQAPIVDVITYNGRKTMKSASFGSDPDLVGRHALAMMQGFQQAGVAAMGKHFPGYGSVATDAHKGLSEIHKDFQQLDRTDIAPMKLLIRHGLNGIMTGHVLTHCVDEEYPATMSHKMITGYLRKELGFEGIVETDAIRMPAIHERYGTKTAVVKAIQAGCDLVLLRGDRQHFEEGYSALYEAVVKGSVPIELVDAALLRIFREKDKIGLLQNKTVNASKADAVVGCRAHRELGQRLAQKSVVLKRSACLPLKSESKVLVISVEPQKLYAAQDPVQCVDMLYQALKPYLPSCKGEVVKLKPSEEEAARIASMLKDYDYVLIATCNALLYPAQAALVNKIVQDKKDKAVVVAMDSPYDEETVPHIQNYICTYGVARASAEEAAKILCGYNKKKE